MEQKLQTSFKLLLTENAGFHGGANGGVTDLRIGNEVLDYLFRTVDSSMTTLETGSGFTTATLALTGCRHTAIAPFPKEFDRIKSWCDSQSVSYENIDFIEGQSQYILPNLKLPKLDLVILDGAHEFPIPCVDFAFCVEAIKAGGRLVLDDLQIPSVAVLVSFLIKEAGRWKTLKSNPKTIIFEKCTEFGRIDWFNQPFNKTPSN